MADPVHTAIAGSSFGGLAALYVLARCGFGKAICMSPSLWVGVDSPNEHELPALGMLQHSELFHLVAPTLSAHPHPQLWVDWGVEHYGNVDEYNAV